MLKEFLNGPVRKSLEWLVGVSTVHPSTHRLKNALGLTVGMMGGRYVMDRAVGETPDGDKIDKEDVPLPLQPIHGALAYDHYSDNVSDRWKHVVDMWVPAGMGAVGAVLGSQNFGLEQPLIQEAEKALKDSKLLTLDKAEDAALMLQGKVHRVLAGASAMFGSSSNTALIPGPTNYGVELGAAFLPYVRRNKLYTPWAPKVAEFVSGNKQPYAYGPSSMLITLRENLLQNPDAASPTFRKNAEAILEPWFGQRVTEEHVDAFLKPLMEARGKAYKPGGVPVEARVELGKLLDGYLKGTGLEKHLLENVKLNPAEAMIGRNGALEAFARSLGAQGMLEKLEESFQKSVIARHGAKAAPNLALNAASRAADHHTLMGGLLVMGGMLSGVGYLAYQSMYGEKKPQDEPSVSEEVLSKYRKTSTDGAAENGTDLASSPTVDAAAATAPKERSGSILLKGIERVTDGLNAPLSLSMHRTSCALGLTIGGFIGTEVANVIAGRTLGGAPLPIEKVPEFLKKLYKTMPYNPHSQHSRDRWGYVMHFGLPAAFATAGVVIASDMFFKSRKKRVSGEAEYLEDFEDRATMAVANAYTLPAALTAVPVTPSGFACLPFVNYGSMLGTRFMLASGRKGVMPGLGELWTGSTSRFPEGPVKLRDRMIQEAVNNKAHDPEQLEEMMAGIVRQWFPKANDQVIHAMTEKLKADREPFYKDGIGVPEDVKEECEKAIAKHFKDAGLEQTLREFGLDPLQATLGNNGLASTIAKYMGADEPVKAVHQQFAEKYTARVNRSRGQAEMAASV